MTDLATFPFIFTMVLVFYFCASEASYIFNQILKIGIVRGSLLGFFCSNICKTIFDTCSGLEAELPILDTEGKSLGNIYV